MTKQVLKWAVPVDDNYHPIGSGPVALVDTQSDNPAVVYVWTEEVGTPVMRGARVFGTGHVIPEKDVRVGSTQIHGLVWHVYGAQPKDRP